jgi:hypothetical protein
MNKWKKVDLDKPHTYIGALDLPREIALAALGHHQPNVKPQSGRTTPRQRSALLRVWRKPR